MTSLVQLNALLHSAEQTTSRRAKTSLPEGYSLRYMQVLNAIPSGNTINQSAIIAATDVDRSTLAEMLQRMKSAGHITHEVCPDDNRQRAVRLTQAGNYLLENMAKGMPDISSHLSEGELEQLATLLRKFNNC